MRSFIPSSLRDSEALVPLRQAYLYMFRHAYWQSEVGNMRALYRPFVRPDSLVFDIGAHVGDRTRIFLDLGARVVAVEPTPESVKQLKAIRSNKLTVVQAAVGKESGVAPFYVSEMSYLNSLSADWTDMMSAAVTTKVIDVNVLTLDALIEEFGMPDFVKIDVEGHEFEVLSGLSNTPPALNFEFHSDAKDAALSCIRRFAGCEFNYAFVCSADLMLQEWVPAEEVSRLIWELPPDKFGDIFVRQRLSVPATS
jgi:FkbM family methyltransferase